MLVYRLDDPVDAWITTNGLVLRIDQDNFKVFVCRVLVDPVRIDNSKICTPTTDTFLGSRLERPLVFELIYTLVGGFAYADNTLINDPTKFIDGSDHK